MKLITVQFGSVGSSWFALIEQRTNGKLLGMRWNPSYLCWGNLVELAATEQCERRPTATKPELPSAELVEKIADRARDTRAKAKAKLATAKAFQKRLDAGETITVRHAWKRWNYEERRVDAEGDTMRVVKTLGRWLLCEAPVPLTHGLSRIEAIKAEEVEAS